jgi:GNAT superfamily N-acetyltransferase
MDYKIRNAEPRDITEIIRLCAEHAEYEQAEFSASGKAEKLMRFLFAENPPAYCLVVENTGGGLLGYTTFMPEFSTWDAGYYVFMDCLFLRPHARNFGIGEQLIRAIARFAKERGIGQLQWQTPVFNERAVKFYRRIGATTKVKTRLFVDEQTIEKLAK